MATEDDLWRRELTPEVIAHLLELSGPVPRDRRLPPSRLLLLQAYDAAHTRPEGRYQPCALQQVRKGILMNRQLRLAATLEIYRKLTGDASTAAETLSKEAEAIAKKRDAARQTPSAALRRWLGEPPLASTAQANGGLIANVGRERTSVTQPGVPVGQESQRAAAAGSSHAAAYSPASPGPGSYHTSQTNMAKSIDASRRSAPFVKPSHTPTRRAQTPPPQRAPLPFDHHPPRTPRSPPSPSPISPAFYYSNHNTIGKRTRATGRPTSAFASRTVAHETELPSARRPDDPKAHSITPGPGEYETSGHELSRVYAKQSFQQSRSYSPSGPGVQLASGSFHFPPPDRLSARSSGVVDPVRLSGPLKPPALVAPASYWHEGSGLHYNGGEAPPVHGGGSSSSPVGERSGEYGGAIAVGPNVSAFAARSPRAASPGPLPFESPANGSSPRPRGGGGGYGGGAPSPGRREPFGGGTPSGSRSTSAPHLRPSPTYHHESYQDPRGALAEQQQQQQQQGAGFRWQRSEREREVSRLRAERESSRELAEAEMRAAAAMDELARVHEHLNAEMRGGRSPFASPGAGRGQH